MSLNAGSNVVVSDAEVVSGGSVGTLKRDIYDAIVAATTLPTLTTLGQTTDPFSASRPATQADVDNSKLGRAKVKQAIAAFANGIGSAVISHFVTNAVITTTITTSDTGLQRMPASTAEDTDTKAPGTNKTLSGTIA